MGSEFQGPLEQDAKGAGGERAFSGQRARAGVGCGKVQGEAGTWQEDGMGYRQR